MKNILFRADSSSVIGTGHIMRDLVLAEQYKSSKITFAVQKLDGNINHKISEKKYDIELLQSNAVEEVIKLVEALNIDLVVIDHYSIDASYEKTLKEAISVQILSFDDTYEKHCCDILLNHNVYADSQKYNDLVAEGCELRCGSDFTLLREEFVEAKRSNIKHRNGIMNNVFIAMGGADHSNINISILRVLDSFPDLHAYIVSTTANAHLHELKAYVDNKKNVTLHINTNQIAKLMCESDFAIVTPSVTMNEVLYMDLPFVAINTVDNQKEMYKYLFESGYLVQACFDADDLENKIKHRKNLSGVEWINFTDLSRFEKEMVLEWRNHPNIRKWMFNQGEIQLDEHMTFIQGLDSKKDRLYFLVRKGSDNLGVIDFTNIKHGEKITDFGIYANPSLKGLGKLLMELVITYAFNTLKVDTLVSEVFSNNSPAIKLYIKYGFLEVRQRTVNNKSVICMELNR